MSEAECSRIGEEVERFDFGREENNPDWPRGCYIAAGNDEFIPGETGNWMLYYNSHHEGSGHEFAQPICLKPARIIYVYFEYNDEYFDKSIHN